jgi:hypothetical protein
MIGPMQKYPVNAIGTKLSPMPDLEGVYVDKINGGRSDWKGTLDYGKRLYQFKVKKLSNVMWNGGIVLDLHNEWQEIFARRDEIYWIELIVGDEMTLTSTVQDWINYGSDVETPNGERRLLPKDMWVPLTYT